MAKLTAAKRKNMPISGFAGTGKSFPINDDEHARLAIGGATRAMRAGNITPKTAASIKAQARKKLGITKTKKTARPKIGAAALKYNITKKPSYS